jgi:pyrroline-5-carboxylate reductase
MTHIILGQVIEKSNLIIWAVKPQIFPTALSSIKYDGSDPKFHVSIMAGIQLMVFTKAISTQFKQSQSSTARVMPNLAMKVKFKINFNKMLCKIDQFILTGWLWLFR